MFTYDPPQLSQKARLFMVCPLETASSFMFRLLRFRARAGNKARCGVAAATRSKSPGETDGGVLHKTSRNRSLFFCFPTKNCHKGSKDSKWPSDENGPKPSILHRLSPVKWSYVSTTCTSAGTCGNGGHVLFPIDSDLGLMAHIQSAGKGMISRQKMQS